MNLALRRASRPPWNAIAFKTTVHLETILACNYVYCSNKHVPNVHPDGGIRVYAGGLQQKCSQEAYGAANLKMCRFLPE